MVTALNDTETITLKDLLGNDIHLEVDRSVIGHVGLTFMSDFVADVAHFLEDKITLLGGQIEERGADPLIFIPEPALDEVTILLEGFLNTQAMQFRDQSGNDLLLTAENLGDGSIRIDLPEWKKPEEMERSLRAGLKELGGTYLTIAPRDQDPGEVIVKSNKLAIVTDQNLWGKLISFLREFIPQNVMVGSRVQQQEDELPSIVESPIISAHPLTGLIITKDQAKKILEVAEMSQSVNFGLKKTYTKIYMEELLEILGLESGSFESAKKLSERLGEENTMGFDDVGGIVKLNPDKLKEIASKDINTAQFVFMDKNGNPVSFKVGVDGNDTDIIQESLINIDAVLPLKARLSEIDEQAILISTAAMFFDAQSTKGVQGVDDVEITVPAAAINRVLTGLRDFVAENSVAVEREQQQERGGHVDRLMRERDGPNRGMGDRGR